MGGAGHRSTLAPANHLLPQDPVLLDEVGNHVGLVATDEAGKGHEQDLDRVGVGQHRPILSSVKAPESRVNGHGPMSGQGALPPVLYPKLPSSKCPSSWGYPQLDSSLIAAERLSGPSIPSGSDLFFVAIVRLGGLLNGVELFCQSGEGVKLACA